MSDDKKQNRGPKNAPIGHNKPPRVGGVAVDQLKSIITRVERLEEEKASIAADIRDVFAEAKGNGFDVKAIKEIIKLRRKDSQTREEEEAVLDVYKRALGMLPLLEDLEEEETAEWLRALDPEKVYEVAKEHGMSRAYVDKLLGREKADA